MLSVLVLDDDILHRTYITQVLKDYFPSEISVVDVDTGLKAANYLANTSQLPHLCVFDMWVPGKKGIEVATEVWSKSKDVPILFWSQHSDELSLRSIFAAVPNDVIYGYLIKTNDKKIIHTALDHVFKMELCWVDPKIVGIAKQKGSKSDVLTALEFETLIDLAMGLSDNAIANRRFITKRGIQNRLASLYAKLGIADEQFSQENWGSVFSLRTRAVNVALSRGLLTLEQLNHENQLLKKWLAKLGK